MTRRHACLVAGSALAVASLAGCGTEHPTTSELKAVPGAIASYPGSVAVGGQGAREGEHTLVDSSGAVLFGTYCVDADQSEVVRWYTSELDHDGWKADRNTAGTTTTDVVATQEWRRDGRRFTLELLSPAYVGRLGATQGRSCRSGYRTVVQ